MQNTYVITNRQKKGRSYGNEPTSDGSLDFLVAQGEYVDAVTKFKSKSKDDFLKSLLSDLKQLKKEGEAQAALYIHGYNTDFKEDLEEMAVLGKNLKKAGYPGIIIGFNWPSHGRKLGYLGDRDNARDSVSAFIHLMHLLKEIRQPADQCWIDLSLIAFSMGCYLLREGLHYFAKHVGYPLNDIYFNQTILFGADISFDSLERNEQGAWISSFSHRVTTYFSIHDPVLGLSRNIKHFGKRRLGRRGPDPNRYDALPENVVAVDGKYVATNENIKKYGGGSVHDANFYIPDLLKDMVATLSSVDRAVITNRAEVPGSARRAYVLQPEGHGTVATAASGHTAKPHVEIS